MKKYTVWGEVTVSVAMTVEAESEIDAMEIADEEFGGITNYAGNGGCDKLIGVDGSTESIEADGEVSWNFAEEW